MTESNGKAETLHMARYVAAAHSSPSAAVTTLPNGVQAIILVKKGSGAVFEDEKGLSLVVPAAHVHMAGLAQGAEPQQEDEVKPSTHRSRR